MSRETKVPAARIKQATKASKQRSRYSRYIGPSISRGQAFREYSTAMYMYIDAKKSNLSRELALIFVQRVSGLIG